MQTSGDSGLFLVPYKGVDNDLKEPVFPITKFHPTGRRDRNQTLKSCVFIFYDPYILYPVSNFGFYREVLRDWLLITTASVRDSHRPKVRAQILVTRGHGNPLGSV